MDIKKFASAVNPSKLVDKLPNNVSVALARHGAKLEKNSPEIMFVGGVASMLVGTVYACRATLKIEDALQETNTLIQKVKDTQSERYSEKDRQHDLAVLYTRGLWKIVRNYAPAITFTVIGVGLLTKSHSILNRRNAGLMAAYAGLDKAFNDYRGRVSEKLGVDEERELFTPTAKVEREDPETGKTVKKEGVTGKGGSPYARIFDESCKNWNREYPYNQTHIQTVQNYCNDLLKARGHVFLNEVYDMIGLERSPEGALVGWVLGNGDGYIDFGVFDGNTYDATRFVMGDEASVWLDFNVDGVIWDKI